MIETKIQKLNKKIAAKCHEVGRDFKEIKLVAVSKRKSFDLILEANKYGINDFGENKAQELKQKNEFYEGNFNWHFIGHLQTNKVKDIVPIAHLIHSVDSIKLAKEINKRASNVNKVQNILLEINTSGEESKFGIEETTDIYALAEYCKGAENINLEGLMTMAPYTDNENIIRKSFESLRNIFVKLNEEGFNLRELSMGMTNDFEIAIEEGATILRIGTAIFGTRN